MVLFDPKPVIPGSDVEVAADAFVPFWKIMYPL
jgi:hypothetical protein